MSNPGQDLFESALAAEGVSGKLADLARSIYFQESAGGRNTKTSNAGAMGGMQIIPGTFNEVADKGWDMKNPEHNARAGIRYLKVLDKQAGGDPALTAAGYYGGPGGLEKARKGIPVSDPRNPNAPNTLEYGQQVVARMERASGQGRLTSAPAPVAQGATGEGPRPEMVPDVPAPVQVAVSPALPVVAPGGGVGGAPLSAGGADPWQAFLRKMPSQTPPLQVADLDFMRPKPVNFSLPPKGGAGRAPNFAAFSAWKGHAA